MRIDLYRFDEVHYFAVVPTLGPQELAVRGSVGQIDDGQQVLVGQGASKEVHSVYVVGEGRTTERADI